MLTLNQAICGRQKLHSIVSVYQLITSHLPFGLLWKDGTKTAFKITTKHYFVMFFVVTYEVVSTELLLCRGHAVPCVITPHSKKDLSLCSIPGSTLHNLTLKVTNTSPLIVSKRATHIYPTNLGSLYGTQCSGGNANSFHSSSLEKTWNGEWGGGLLLRKPEKRLPQKQRQI